MFLCLPGKSGGNYTFQGSDHKLKAFLWADREVSPYSHPRAVGKTLQGHPDKMNLLKDQIFPVD